MFSQTEDYFVIIKLSWWDYFLAKIKHISMKQSSSYFLKILFLQNSSYVPERILELYFYA